jgi:hypothetical protein
MKGDKGMLYTLPNFFVFVLTLFVEFSGTLLGFDDYVSKYLEVFQSTYVLTRL